MNIFDVASVANLLNRGVSGEPAEIRAPALRFAIAAVLVAAAALAMQALTAAPDLPARPIATPSVTTAASVAE